ncbi:hypothetical protein CRUP_037842 [Coryphaenoides rupestris]|nr:hypothetical protein CRUP_037842 [Coryphaenoides rupestris]
MMIKKQQQQRHYVTEGLDHVVVYTGEELRSRAETLQRPEDERTMRMSCKMKKIFTSLTKKKKFPSNTSDNGSTVSGAGGGYDLKEKDLAKVHKAALLGDVLKLVQLAKKNDINQLDKENSGHVDVVQFLVECKAKLNLCDNQNRSALMKAVQCQHDRCVGALLEGHADPNLVDINGNTALHLAASIPASSTAMLLLEHEANVNAQNKVR